LKELLRRFNGRVDLVLASYNAGEGAVVRFGHRVPPYRETRNYVRKVGYRYRKAKSPVGPTSSNGTTVAGN
ncbi:MAG: lytic transglycosylase domain-containing protein, partial [Pyrinomonadaceae bacterium]